MPQFPSSAEYEGFGAGGVAPRLRIRICSMLWIAGTPFCRFSMQFDPKRYGYLALKAGEFLPLKIMRSPAGFYIGTSAPNGEPNTRESACYWPKRPDAVRALETGKWPQKLQF